MGLDIYVGPLTRYYAGAWETVVQQQGRMHGMEVHVVRPPGFQRFQTIDEAQTAVAAWREELQAALAQMSDARLDWPEAPTGEYWTDKPDHSGDQSVRMLAAHEEFPRTPLPKRAGKSQALTNLVNDRYGSSPRSPSAVLRRLIGRPKPPPPISPFEEVYFGEMWLPIDVETTIEAPDVWGRRIRFGSVARLRQQLSDLNDAALRGNAATLDEWRRVQPGDGGFLGAARFGLACWLQLAEIADERRQPMILDW